MTEPNKYPEHVTRCAITEQRYPSENGRFQRHATAYLMAPGRIFDPGDNMRQFENGIVSMLSGLAAYAGAHVRQYGSPIAEDQVMGVAWRQSLAGLQQLLTGERGRLDGGTLDHAILELYKAAGFEGDEP